MLLEWQEQRTERLTEIDNQMRDWEELQQVLGGSTLEELANQAATARDEAVLATARTDAEVLAAALAGPGVVASREATGEHQRVALLHEIDERRRQEREHTEAIAAVTTAETTVVEAARLVGVVGDKPDELVVALRSWQDDRNTELEEADGEIEKWEELQRILGQDSLDKLKCEVERLCSEARDLSDQVGVEDMTRLTDPPTDVAI